MALLIFYAKYNVLFTKKVRSLTALSVLWHHRIVGSFGVKDPLKMLIHLYIFPLTKQLQC